MALSKKTGVMLAVLVSAVSYTAIACDREPEVGQRLSQANLVENEAVVTGEILGIEDESVRLQLPDGELKAIMIPRTEIQRLALLPKRVITAELNPAGRATEVRLGEVVYPIQADTQEAVELAQVESAPAAAPETTEVVPVPPDPTPIAQAQAPAPDPTSIAQAQPQAEPPAPPVRALW